MRLFQKVVERTVKPLLPVVTAGFPGGQKVVFFLLVEYAYGLETLGLLGSIYSFAQIVGFFTAVGWCTLLMVRIPNVKNLEEEKQLFYTQLKNGLIVLCLIGVVLSPFILIYYDYIYYILALLFALSWTLYQYLRHLLLAKLDYSRLVYIDTLVFIVMCMSVWIADSLPSLLILYSSLLIVVCVIQVGIIIGVGSSELSLFPIERKGLEFGFSNFLSGGIFLSIVPIATMLEGARFGGVVALFLSVVSLALLLPRAISLRYLPTLSKEYMSNSSWKLTLNKANKYIKLASMLAVAFNSLFFIGLYFFEYIEFYSRDLSLAYFVMHFYLSSVLLGYSNLLMVHEESWYITKIGMASLLIYFLFVVVSFIANIAESTFLIVIVGLGVSTFLRYYMIKSKASRILHA